LLHLYVAYAYFYSYSMFIPKSFYSSVDVEYDIENILLTPTDNLTTTFDKSSETLSLTLQNFMILYCIQMKFSIHMYDLITG